ncbi:MAG: hypothetical protein ACFFDT_20585 [Candidatus Hodarchaeota archaeon]
MSKAGIDYQSLYKKFTDEKHYWQQFERYKSMMSEDLEKFQEENACTKQEALLAMYVSDFVVTSSNLRDLSITDDERRVANLKFCKVGLEQDLELDMLIYLHMLAQELAKTARLSYAQQLELGVPINVALVRLADTFVVPFLKFLRSLSDKIPLQWMVALTEGAISDIQASEIYEKIIEKNYLSNYREYLLADAALSSLQSFGKLRTDQPNPHATVPLLAESTGAILVRSISKNEEYFGYSEPLDDKHLKRLHKEFSEVCTLTKFEKQNIEPIYYRAISTSSTQVLTRQIFLIRSCPPNSDFESWFFLNTTADDLNLELNRRRLEERCQDIIGVLRRPVRKKKRPKKVKKKEKPVKTEEKGKFKPIPHKKAKKPSLIRRVFGIFKRKSVEEKPSIPQKPTEHKEPEKPIEKVPKKKIEEIIESELEIDEWNLQEVLSIWAKTLVVDAVAGINLEEVYDTIREKDYIITGMADFPDISKSEGTLFSIPGKTETLDNILVSIGPHFTELRDIAAQLLPPGVKETQLQFIPQEVFLEHTKSDIETYDLLTFAASPSSLTVLLAQNSHIKSPILLAPNKALSKRRTLQMRTRQLASDKSRAPFKVRMGNVLINLIDTTALESRPISTHLVHELLPEKND